MSRSEHDRIGDQAAQTLVQALDLVRERHTASTAAVRERVAALEVALGKAIEQLDGWVSWKCPKKYRAEHDAFIDELRQLLLNKPNVG